MLLDPFTVGAQILNFLILVWLLRRVLYGPVTRAMNERESRIRRQIEDARRLRAEADAERERHQQQVAAFAADQEARLAAARAEVEAWRQAQIETARQEIEARRERWRHALAEEQKTVVGELHRKVGHELVLLTRRALQDLADAELEERMIARFLERLRDMSADDRERLRAAAHEDGQRVHVRTAHPLAGEERARLRDAIGNVLGADLAAHFEASPHLGSGIELRAGGLKVAWSLNEYLASLEERLAAAFGDTPAFDDEPA